METLPLAAPGRSAAEDLFARAPPYPHPHASLIFGGAPPAPGVTRALPPRMGTMPMPSPSPAAPPSPLLLLLFLLQQGLGLTGSLSRRLDSEEVR
jgi:hypothetical protein